MQFSRQIGTSLALGRAKLTKAKRLIHAANEKDLLDRHFDLREIGSDPIPKNTGELTIMGSIWLSNDIRGTEALGASDSQIKSWGIR